MAYVFNPFTGNLDTTDVVAFNGEVNAGTEGSPSLFFTGDPDTGIYSPGADQLAISTGGNERLRIDSSGNVGIGVSSPADKMEIVAATNAGLQIGAASGTGSIGVQIAGVMDAIPTARVRGYIGTTNSSAGVAGDLLIAPRTSSAASIRFITRGSGSPSEAVRIDSSGDVGIGVSSPQFALDIRRDTGVADLNIRALDTVSASDARLYLNASSVDNSNSIIYFGQGGSNQSYLQYKHLTAGDYFRFVANGQERLRIDGSGRLLVGTSSDSGGALLQVNGDRVRVATAKTPASASDTGTTGEICWDANYIYVCVATNTWKRTAIATW